jgi:DNA-binding SARP family transcriptional activator
MARLSLTLLGGFHARLDPGPALALPTRKAQALLAYLGLPPGQAHPRDQLAALLWGGIREASARASLRQALFAIRKGLGDAERDVLRQAGATLALAPEAVEVDAAAFERLVREGTPEALERATALYGGDLLSGFALEEAPFEEWLLGERERLRELALEGLARLLAHRRTAGPPEAAIQTAVKLLHLDPLQEAVHRALMRLYAEHGRRGAALRQYQQCVSVLGRELGIEPEAETKSLYQEILRQQPSRRSAVGQAAAGPTPGASDHRAAFADVESELIGRAPEMDELRAALQSAIAGGGRVVCVVGEAGIGKSRLIAELAADAARRGVTVLLGRSYESEQILPFGPWVDAMRAGRLAEAAEALADLGPTLRHELARVLPEIGDPPAPGTTDVHLIFESVTQLMRNVASRAPTLLVLEDLHWADEMSARLLAFAGRRFADRPVLLVATAREEEMADAPALRQALVDLRPEARLMMLALRPLSRPDTLALVRAFARSGDDAALDRLGEQAWVVSEGNPFIAVETVRTHAERASVAHGGTLALPERVREIVSRRLERLSERGRLLTTVAAVIGAEFEFALLWRAAGLVDTVAADGMEELVRRRVFHGVGERFDFTHDRIREVARAGLLAPRRRVLHRRVAEAIEAVYADDLEPHILALGLQYQGAEMWPQAMSYLRRAAAHAFAQSAYREAATCVERALGAASHQPRTPEMLHQMLDLQLQLRTALWPLAEFERIAKCLEEAERLATSLDDRGRLGRIAAFMSVLRWVTGDSRAARFLGQRAREVAVSLEDRPLLVMSNHFLGLARFLLAEYREAEDVFLENVRMLTLAEKQDPLGAMGSPLIRSNTWVVVPLAERGAFVAGLAHGRAALELAEAARDPYGVVSAGYCLAYLHCLKGELDVAVPLLERGLALCREREFGVWLPQVTGYLGHAYSRAGRLEDGLSLLERAIDIFDATRAWPFRVLLTVHRGSACLAAGRLDAALALGRQALTLAREHGERGHEAWALRLLGDVASDGDDAPRAERCYREALALADELGMRPLVAHCHLDLGKLHHRRGDAARTREHLTTAAAMYREMDMAVSLAQAEAAMGAP